ncbi:MAG: hypothetical protein D6725_14735 [Planctomycetota bacterium]|nr:MAG: hypothetical protein D6725_14735 [Planctomycetota bacterium]
MNTDNIEITVLQRIATALERIADSLERTPAVTSAEELPRKVARVFEPVADSTVETSDAREPSPPPQLTEFLESKGIQIKTVPTPEPADAVLDSLARLIGDRYAHVAPLLAHIKRTMQHGEPFTMGLRSRPAVEIGSICQLCTRLHDVAFLVEYTYSKSPCCVLRARPSTLPKAQNFFSGGWLERYVRQIAESAHAAAQAETESTLPFECLANPQIVLPDGADFELDVLVRIGVSTIWIEAKTGCYQQHVAKYARVARLLGLDYDHSFMILPHVPSHRCEELGSLFSMTVCNLDSFEDALLDAVRRDHRALSATTVAS